ncbi:riboflavin biosynthesis pyrimidine reductase/pyrimidine deaminase RibD-like protein [Kibdelosporangium banguiense]|uniref:Riboflavin biosynthesis protein RibD n=1 Tax=Kibdelosporangium banguiense TaxID=1365924 RepID=A0ABS4TLF2_9PSEU|nr:riboflavin biosynthesis pyrimidine reductase/pyrimidine deaminase RibD-like protein [Kibdelosporangium banguiense]
MSVDGYIDDAHPERLVLSGDEDWDRVDELRASCDAILVGANTIRSDNPRLRVRSQRRRAERVARGLPANPLRVTMTRAGGFDPDAEFFADDNHVVYERAELSTVVEDLYRRGVRRLMVEGGSSVHTGFLTSNLADEIQLAIAPIFVGDSRAPRFVNDGEFAKDRMVLGDISRVGDVTVMRFFPDADRYWLRECVSESLKCPPSETAYPVGAVIVGADGREIARGYSRETDPTAHAEEEALAKVTPGDLRLATATIYSSLEPCSTRKSRPRSCSQWILDAGIPRVVFALREPSRFVVGEGFEQLSAAGVSVVERADLAPEAGQASPLYR